MFKLHQVPMFMLFLSVQVGSAAAQTVPSSFKDMEFLVKAGDRVTVVDVRGVTITGKISELDASTLSIASANGPRRFAEDDVVVVRQRRPDPLKNGALIGAVIGAGMGLMSEFSCGGGEYCGQLGWVTVGSTLWGVGVGVFTDALLKTPTDVFRQRAGTTASWSVVPVVGRDSAGARLALRW